MPVQKVRKDHRVLKDRRVWQGLLARWVPLARRDRRDPVDCQDHKGFRGFQALKVCEGRRVRPGLLARQGRQSIRCRWHCSNGLPIQA